MEFGPLRATARAIQEERFKDTQVHVNAHMTPTQIKAHYRLDNKSFKVLEATAERLSFSARDKAQTFHERS